MHVSVKCALCIWLTVLPLTQRKTSLYVIYEIDCFYQFLLFKLYRVMRAWMCGVWTVDTYEQQRKTNNTFFFSCVFFAFFSFNVEMYMCDFDPKTKISLFFKHALAYNNQLFTPSTQLIYFTVYKFRTKKNLT